ncbi:MAG: UDP-N-acetylmuramoyl-tripeptide--D-alanyl-D-alanine ligase [Gammaproteobacteria bacterium]|nr:UDP-N-acetylmuramoyl-tripeptide--D-alanyl-D-alanine ligase [Gammaproteobacteria bacterium]
MIEAMRLSSAADRLGGELHGVDVEFGAVSIDTRTLQSGDLYLAIHGDRFDGNDFVDQAREKGACAAVVSRLSDTDIPQLLVKDTTVALGQIAALNRLASKAKLIAITGSQGKTTVKEMTGSILERVGPTLVTRGNLNNAIGVPLTLLELSVEHEFGVIEMGANRAGDIAYSVGLVKPDVAIITVAARAHIEGFGSLEGVAEGKGEMIDGLGPDGTMVLNRDDRFFDSWNRRAGDRKVVSFSVRDRQADYCAGNVQRGQDGRLTFQLSSAKGKETITLSLLGRHNVINALAAAALATEVGAGNADVREGLECIEPVKGRLSPVDNVLGGALIDDSYNASPDSFRAAIDVLADFDGYRILLVGDMAELGTTTHAAHAELGRYAREAGIEELWTIGEDAEQSSLTFGTGAHHFSDKEEVILRCQEVLRPGITLLVKGSRSAGLDAIIQALADDQAARK